MRHVFLLTILVSCTALACSNDERKASQSVTPAVGDPGRAEPGSGVNPKRDYACTDGTTFSARITDDDAVVTLQGNTLKLEYAQKGGGTQYTGEGVTYVPQGNEAVLMRAGAATVRCTAK